MIRQTTTAATMAMMAMLQAIQSTGTQFVTFEGYVYPGKSRQNMNALLTYGTSEDAPLHCIPASGTCVPLKVIDTRDD